MKEWSNYTEIKVDGTRKEPYDVSREFTRRMSLSSGRSLVREVKSFLLVNL